MLEYLVDLGSVLFLIFAILLAPLTIQYLLYLPAKKLFKKTRPEELYSICLVINTALLLIYHHWLAYPDPDEGDHLDGMLGPMFFVIWAPFYIGILISCICRSFKAKSKENKSEDEEP
ncbi:MAG: hypothetical protein II762_08875 [Ruminococcus sp.]|nr:hypothetical protein [Ruminococcus sp.]